MTGQGQRGEPTTPVEIVAPTPVPVVVVDADAGGGASLTPTTTAQQDLTTAGQRHINAIWERTQQVIAIAVSGVTLGVCGYITIQGDPTVAVPAFMLLSNVFFLVVGTYFQRTNHTKIGGIGPNESGR